MVLIMGEKKWFVLRVISGKERKLKEAIDFEVERNQWEEAVTQILVPTEKIYKIRNGKKIIQEKNMFPGYIYMEVDDNRINGDILNHITSINGVINFLGGKNPESLRSSEVQKLLGKVDEMAEMGESLNEPFIINETVKIIDGPFNDFLGTIEEIYDEKKKLKVIVKIFGRRTPVEVNFLQVEKVS
jgi:transcriptional antiterminator NusG